MKIFMVGLFSLANKAYKNAEKSFVVGFNNHGIVKHFLIQTIWGGHRLQFENDGFRELIICYTLKIILQ